MVGCVVAGPVVGAVGAGGACGAGVDEPPGEVPGAAETAVGAGNAGVANPAAGACVPVKV